jgi:hypothetical protein
VNITAYRTNPFFHNILLEYLILNVSIKHVRAPDNGGFIELLKENLLILDVWER